MSAKGKLERMERGARRPQQRRGEWHKGLKKVMEGIKGQFEKFDDAMVRIERRMDLGAQEGTADGPPRLADLVQDTLREDRPGQNAEQAMDSEAWVQKALRDATVQVQEVRILRDTATTMVVEAQDHMQQ